MAKFALAEVWKLLDKITKEGRETVNKVEAPVNAEYEAGMTASGTLGVDKDGNVGLFGRLAASGGVAAAPVADATVELGGDAASERHTEYDTNLEMRVSIKLSRPAMKLPPSPE